MLPITFDFSSQHILCVDDTKSNLLLLELMLNALGVTHVYQASHAEEAYEIVQNNPIDALLLDVMMPDINGIEVTKHLRAQSVYDDIPIIMVTANNDDETFIECFKTGANDFLSKPINPTILEVRLSAQLQKRQMQQSLIQQSRFSAMDEIISMLAHQWRQPLTHINSVASTIRTRLMLQEVPTEELEDALAKIETYVFNLSKSISNFQENFSTNDHPSCTDLQKLVNESRLTLEKLLTKNGITIKEHYDKNIPELLCNHRTLLQVFINLLTNAIESFERHPVENPTISLWFHYSHNLLDLIIEDNGQGIDEKDIPYIFEPYFTTKEEKNGRGLGLYFSRQLVVEQLNGTLELRSNASKTKAHIAIDLPLC